MTRPFTYMEFQEAFNPALAPESPKHIHTASAAQRRLDMCMQGYVDHGGYVPKKNMAWLTLIVQAVINAMNGGKVEEIFNSMNSK